MRESASEEQLVEPRNETPAPQSFVQAASANKPRRRRASAECQMARDLNCQRVGSGTQRGMRGGKSAMAALPPEHLVRASCYGCDISAGVAYHLKNSWLEPLPLLRLLKK
jgi:hypothetical protein